MNHVNINNIIILNVNLFRNHRYINDRNDRQSINTEFSFFFPLGT